jgi:hypothetical protein
VTGSFPMPARAESRLRTDGVGWILGNISSGSGQLGLATRTDPSGDGNSVNYTVQYIELPDLDPATDVSTSYCVLRSSNYSCSILDGYPGSGPQDVEILDLPQVTNPPSARAYPLHDPIEWTTWDTGVTPILMIDDDLGTVWTVRAQVGDTRLVVPELPSVVDPTDLLGTGVVQASFVVYRLRPDSVNRWQSYAVAAPYVLQP